MESVRMDKWLWAARCFKTRTLASKACEAGHCKLNGSSAKPSKQVKPGDRVDVLTPGGRRVLQVVALAERRGSASAAQTLFEDHTPQEERAPDEGRRERGAGRPTGRDRRRMKRFRGR